MSARVSARRAARTSPILAWVSACSTCSRRENRLTKRWPRSSTKPIQIQYRQLSVVDGHGGSTAFSGERVLGTYDIARAPYVATAGNLLKDQTIPARMVAAFEEKPESDLEDRLLSAMKTALSLGGEEGPVHSAGLKIAGSVPWPETDLRVDWSDDPIHDLEKLWRLWRPLKDDYVTRALDPATAPTYGVPGDQ